MAITPTKVLDITAEEQKQLVLVEERIDQILIDRFQPGGLVTYPVKKRWRPGFIAALVRRYSEAGWKVTEEADSEGVDWLCFRLPNTSSQSVSE